MITHRSVGAWDEVVLEWWRGDRKVTVHLDDDGPEFVAVWGPDCDAEMDAGRLDQAAADRLFAWLFGGAQ